MCAHQAQVYARLPGGWVQGGHRCGPATKELCKFSIQCCCAEGHGCQHAHPEAHEQELQRQRDARAAQHSAAPRPVPLLLAGCAEGAAAGFALWLLSHSDLFRGGGAWRGLRQGADSGLQCSVQGRVF